MIFKGKKPVIHRKVHGEAKCECGVILTQDCSEWVHPEISDIEELDNAILAAIISCDTNDERIAQLSLLAEKFRHNREFCINLIEQSN